MSLITNPVKNAESRSILFEKAVVLSGHTGAVFSIEFSADGHNIASAGMDRTIRLWNLPTTADNEAPNYGVIEGHKKAITSLSWILSSKILSASADSTVSVWDAETGQRLKTGKGHELTVNDCSTSSEGPYLSVGDDGTIRLWDEREKYEVSKIETPYPILACDLSSDGKIAYVAGIDPSVRAYDVSSGSLLWSCDGFTETTTGLALSSDESMLVLRAMDGSVYTINAKSFVPAGVSRKGQTYEGAVGGAQMLVSRAKFSHDDIYICLASDDHLATMWGTASQRMAAKLTGHEAAVVDIDFHPREKILASCALDGDIIVREF
ncbi:hypothetical protein METBIDRAFT_37182 [Metschnikowia bicuspidata var. bicuspidata NRRL YB-4993]|uniref:Uncharacterized protein n=1 Tax=Metschnikowia bicuspidata var. bicuspidata NRRL YB-4993 TaxID=869754 RepID=A0A1A0HJF3_9ASCO|nr:hypothetical protein METBIDRAFT_37182 [Metschnikowia bicuspidata var. bicuspidata NRRL YB-4993]OBA24289.1 hypothetical protein METBIDRAFT_37182 [Metschnikowia bicuspidata var. bicuspidata NRRL YB-4993]